ncbi:hypothetical protein Goklo_012524, partial [Gossypium klotzschianum]|nr:hypothetical protein [Gossypium klotzschianum]
VGSTDWRSTVNYKEDKVVSLVDVGIFRTKLIMLLMEIQELHISYCHNLRSFSDDVFSFKNSTDLKVCTIEQCDGIECVVSFSSSSSHPFQSLKVLFLYKLLKLSALLKVDGFGSATTSILAPSTTVGVRTEIDKLSLCLVQQASMLVDQTIRFEQEEKKKS